MAQLNFRITAIFAIFLIAGVASRTVEETAHDLVEALAHTPFEDWSPAYLATNNPLQGDVLPSTLFIPMSAYAFYDGDKKKAAAYHIVPQKLEFTDLLAKKDGSRLRTLLAGHSILIRNSSAGFFLDGVQLIERDIYVDMVVAIHRVASPLDFTRQDKNSRDWTAWTIVVTCLLLFCLVAACSIQRGKVTWRRA